MLSLSVLQGVIQPHCKRFSTQHPAGLSLNIIRWMRRRCSRSCAPAAQRHNKAAAAAAAVPPPSSPHGPRLPWGWRLPALPLPMAGAVHPGQPRHAAGHVPSPREAHAHAACKRGRCTAAEREKSAAAVGERRRAAGLPWRLPELQRLRWGSAWGAAPGAAAPTGA